MTKNDREIIHWGLTHRKNIPLIWDAWTGGWKVIQNNTCFLILDFGSSNLAAPLSAGGPGSPCRLLAFGSTASPCSALIWGGIAWMISPLSSAVGTSLHRRWTLEAEMGLCSSGVISDPSLIHCHWGANATSEMFSPTKASLNFYFCCMPLLWVFFLALTAFLLFTVSV